MEQPDWCNYPDATVRMFGCWSLVNGLVKDEDFCKDCDCHVKLRKTCEMYCHSVNSELFIAQSGFSNATWHPATKEQRNQLEKAMADAGYTFDFEKKELKKIEQNHTWSEEDDKNLEKAIWYVEKGGKLIFAKTDKLVPWLKSIKDRVQPKQEWSKEDKQYLEDTLTLLEGNRSVHTYGEVKNWLKSLKDRYTWKPSEEQIDTLKEAMYQVGILTPLGMKIYDLCEQLKKLREE